ncbi:hypothetical protein HHUSO_G3509 [Huso huso]|uniref:Uncharacterized protein n=1 Tax=Huso huso TaxID=61971 RepID=A0ABR1A305_HUSHU
MPLVASSSKIQERRRRRQPNEPPLGGGRDGVGIEWGDIEWSQDDWICWNPDPFQTRGNGGLEAYLSSLEDQAWCYLCTEFEHKVACCPFQEEEDDLSAPKQKKKRSGHPRRRAREWVPDPVPKGMPSSVASTGGPNSVTLYMYTIYITVLK